jgi:TetR/AcrR family transcriptional regulator, transcriptional repressor for nem operon
MPKARSRTESETRRKLVDAAVELMLCKGFKATTVDDVCHCAGVTKGSFFHYFTDKEDITKAAANRFRERQQEMFDGADFRSLADPLDRVYGRLDLLAEVARNPKLPKSCLIGNLAQEVSGTHEKIRSVCECAFDSAASDFERDLAAAKLKHAPHANFNPASIARLYVALIQGSMVMAKAAKKAEILQENVEHLRCYIEALIGRSRAEKN